MKLLLIFFMAILLHPFQIEAKKNYIEYADNITAKVSKDLSKKHCMNLIGEGGGMMFDINKMAISFQIFKPLDQNEARKIVVDCALEYAAAINNDKRIRPYLDKYPFEGVQISIFSLNYDRRDLYDPYISVTNFLKGKIYYCTNDKENRWVYKNKIEETLEEALKILESEKNKQ